MKKYRRMIVAAMMAAVMALGAACSLVSVNEDKDNAQVVAKVNGVSITKGQFKTTFNELAYYYQMFGQQITQDSLPQLHTNVMDSLVLDEVIKQKGKELGYDKFTAEEQTKLDADFDEVWNNYLADYRTTAETEATNAGETPSAEELDKRAEEKLLADMQTAGMTKEQMKQDSADQLIYTKAQDAAKAEVSVTDDEVKTAYDEKLAEQKTKYAETPAAYETDAESAIVAYIPPGYVRVKHILIKPEDTDTAYTDYTTKVETLQTEITDLGTQVGALYAEGSAEKQAEIAALDAQISAKKQEEATLRANFLASLKPTADEALAKAKAGEDFDKLIETYGKDPGMTVSPAKEQGYLLSKDSSVEAGGSMDTDFTNASMALANVGDITELVPTSFGYHIIKLVEKVAPGDVPLDTLKEKIREEALTAKQSDHWTARQDEWKAAAAIETFPDIVANVGLE